jgi:hypothetical protein
VLLKDAAVLDHREPGLPGVPGSLFMRPTDEGFEKKLKEKLQAIQQWKKMYVSGRVKDSEAADPKCK